MDKGMDDLGSPNAGRGITNEGLNHSGSQAALATPLGELSPVIEAPRGVGIGWWRPTRLDVVSVCAALALVLGFLHPVAYRVPSLRAAVETVMTLFGLAAAVLVAEQFRKTRRQRELLLFATLVTLAVTEFVASAVPAALQLHSVSGLAAMSAIGQLLAATGFLLAVRTPSHRVSLHLPRPLLATALLSMAACGLAGLVAWLLKGELVSPSSAQSGFHQALGHPLAFALIMVTAALYVWAAAEFVHRGQLERSQVMTLLGEAVLLLAAARLYFLALPWSSPLEVSLREALRLLAFGLIFLAMLRRDLEIRAGAARAAAAAERRRVAQDLHDGLAQDLAFIAAHGSTLGEGVDQEHPVMRAARHALALSRDTISELSNAESSVAETLDVIAQELGDRFGVRVMTDVAPDTTVARDVQDQVGRITREAIANAVRHGQARHVLVTLKRRAAGTALRVVDDGQGIREQFDAADEGFGIRAMRDRAAALGGTFSIRRKPRRGTEVEVNFP